MKTKTKKTKYKTKSTSKSTRSSKEIIKDDKYWASFGKKKKVKKPFFIYHENVSTDVDPSLYVSSSLNIIYRTSDGKQYGSHADFVSDGGLMDGTNVQILPFKK